MLRGSVDSYFTALNRVIEFLIYYIKISAFAILNQPIFLIGIGIFLAGGVIGLLHRLSTKS